MCGGWGGLYLSSMARYGLFCWIFSVLMFFFLLESCPIGAFSQDFYVGVGG